MSVRSVDQAIFTAMVRAGIVPLRGSPVTRRGPDSVDVPLWAVEVWDLVWDLYPTGNVFAKKVIVSNPPRGIVRRLCGDRSFRRMCLALQQMDADHDARSVAERYPSLVKLMESERNSLATMEWEARKLPWEK